MNRHLSWLTALVVLLAVPWSGNNAAAQTQEEEGTSQPVVVGNVLISPVPLSASQVKEIAQRYAASSEATAGSLGPLPVSRWDACSTFDPELRKVSYFDGGVYLRCGNAAKWGYWHIKAEHRSQFVTLSYPTDMRWEDLLYWPIYYAITDPQVKKAYSTAHEACRSRQLLLYDTVRAQLVSAKIYRTVYTYQQPSGADLPNGTIITTYPSGYHCG